MKMYDEWEKLKHNKKTWFCTFRLGYLRNLRCGSNSESRSGFRTLLTRMWIVWVQSIPTRTVPIKPTNSPAFLKALGIANIPVPRHVLTKCRKAPKKLCTLWFSSNFLLYNTCLGVPNLCTRKGRTEFWFLHSY